MPPIALLVIGLAGVGAYLAFHKATPPIDRATAMQRLADILFRMIAKDPAQPLLPGEAEEAVNLAGGVFALVKTVEGIRTSKGLPTDELWPGTNVSVAVYMNEYAKQRRGLPPVRVYNDPAPIAPYQDPRPIRAQALSVERSNPAQAKLLHAKADVLSKLINTKKAAINTQGKGKAILSAAQGLLSVKK